MGATKAASERFTSVATCRIQPDSAGASSRQIAAGFPENGLSVKASTWKKGMAMYVL